MQPDTKPNGYDVFIARQLWGPPICTQMIGACVRRLMTGRKETAMLLYRFAEGENKHG